MTTPKKVWSPPDITTTPIHNFKLSIEKTFNTTLPTYSSLHAWSIQNRSHFWSHCLRTFPIIYTGTIPTPCVDESAPIQSVPIWFRGVFLNFAENVLFSRGKGKEGGKVAVTQLREMGVTGVSHVTWEELRRRVGRLSNALRKRGVKKGDRVALIASTSIDTLTVFLATATVGALFSSSSTDMGVTGLLDRLTQIKPRFVFFDDAAVYNGKTTDLRSKIEEVIAGMHGISEFESVVLQPRFEDAVDFKIPKTETWETFISSTRNEDLIFEQCAFHDPLLIVYSSGTTGPPKCIVHSHGGIVLNGHKEMKLHRDVNPDSVCLQYTTTGWIVYLGSVQALLTGARMICYDGSPFYPHPNHLIQTLERERVSHLGISPRYLATLQQGGVVPREVADLSMLKVITSTGSVLSDALFQWFYDVAFPSSVQLDNISGGTDLAGAWGTGNPMLPVYVGGCQSLSLGMAVEVFDDDPGSTPPKGKRVTDGEPGDLVCTSAFPSMPVFFWGDPTGRTYHDSYFAKYEGVWTHGDFIQIIPETGQVMFLGRADGVLNPSGVRFGSSEIYNVIERHFAEEIVDTICVGQRRKQDVDEQVLLFVLMAPGHKFGPGIVGRLKDVIATQLSKRHVPKFMFETKEIPVTVNGKKVELPVKKIVSGEKVKVSGTLANPGSLEFYKMFVDDEVLRGVERAKL